METFFSVRSPSFGATTLDPDSGKGSEAREVSDLLLARPEEGSLVYVDGENAKFSERNDPSGDDALETAFLGLFRLADCA